MAVATLSRLNLVMYNANDTLLSLDNMEEYNRVDGIIIIQILITPG